MKFREKNRERSLTIQGRKVHKFFIEHITMKQGQSTVHLLDELF